MKKILVIENELQILDSLVEFLNISGFNAIGADNGLVGIQLAREYVPDVILCDVGMPGVSGYQVLTTLQNDPVTASIPFIFLTAQDAPKDFRYGMNLGADDYLTKPCTSLELMDAIAARLTRQEAMQEHVRFKHTPQP